jgi:phenylacetic acid degradation operon negative regulatory protein
LQGGLYVSPHAWEESLRDAAKQLSIEAFVSFASTRTLEIGGVGEPRAIAANLWSIDALAFEYGRFVESFRDVPRSLEELLRNGGSVADAQVVPGALYMAEAWTACSTRDPLLPPELLPRPWPGRTARDVLLRSRRLALSARRDRGALTLFATSFGEATASQSVDNATKGDRS